MLEVIILALALSMDAFAVSIGLGTKQNKTAGSLAWMAAIYFGVFQGLMPLIGYLGGLGVLGWFASLAPWIAFFLLLLIGAKMIYEALSANIEDEIARVSHKIMLILAIATSIDAMAAGFSLTLLEVNPFIACLIIGVITFVFSWIGVALGSKGGNKSGSKSGTWLESKAELLGGIILILIGFRILLA